MELTFTDYVLKGLRERRKERVNKARDVFFKTLFTLRKKRRIKERQIVTGV